MKNMFEGKVALITGGSRGIGLSIAKKLSVYGAKIILVSRHPEMMPAGALDTSDKNLMILPCDIGSRDSVFELINYVEKKNWTVDILINNAAVGLFSPMSNALEKDIDEVMKTNFLGSLWMMQAVLPGMRKNKNGHIIQISTATSMHALYYQGVYSASKAATERIHEAASQEERQYGIRFVLVVPDRTKTSFREYSLGENQYKTLPMNLPESDPDLVAENILLQLGKNKKIIYTSFRSKAFQIFSKYCPSIIDYFSRKYL